MQHLNEQRALQVLTAENSEAIDLPLLSFPGMMEILSLHLSGNAISDPGVKVLTCMELLEVLNLADCPLISSAGLMRLRSHRGLKRG